MKKIFNILTVAALAALCLTACKGSKEPFATVGENDAPRILNTDIPEGSNGDPAQLMSIGRDANFNFEIIVSPAKYTTVTWNIDGVDVFEGLEIDMPLLAGNHLVKVTATTTKGLSTSRTFTVAVSPTAEDPVIAADLVFGAPGQNLALDGDHLDAVKKVLLGTYPATIVSAVYDELVITIPADLPTGVYPVIFENADGEKVSAVYDAGGVFEAFQIAASMDPLVTADSFMAKPGKDVTLEGINLDKVQSILVDGNAVVVTAQSASALTFTCPDVEAGEHTITGTADGGASVSFMGNDCAVLTVVESSEEVLWQGSFDVDWGTPFEVLKTEFAALPAGTIVRAYCTVPDGMDYSMGCMASAWRQILTGHEDPEREDENFSGQSSYVFQYTLNDLSVQMMNELDDNQQVKGAAFVGHGYTIVKVTAEAPSEQTIWEGSFDVDWGTPFEDLKAEFAALSVGKIVRAYCTIADGTDYSMGCMASAWRQILTGHEDPDREDETFSGQSSHVFEYTLNELSIQMMNELDDNQQVKGAAFVGHGYTIVKVTVE